MSAPFPERMRLAVIFVLESTRGDVKHLFAEFDYQNAFSTRSTDAACMSARMAGMRSRRSGKLRWQWESTSKGASVGMGHYIVWVGRSDFNAPAR